MEKQGNLIVLVVGLGRSGRALGDYLATLGRPFYVYDDRGEAAFSELLSRWPRAHFWSLSDVMPERCITALWVSPGVPPSHPLLQESVRCGIPVVGELEVAAMRAKAPMIAVTGTNGKSTTVALVEHFLNASGRRARACGNFGIPLLEVVESGESLDALVVEVSSFQAETSPTFKPRYAALLNLSSDHLDRYPSMEAYLEAKEKMVVNQDAGDVLVVNAEEPAFLPCVRRSKATVIAFSSAKAVPEGAFLKGESLVFRRGGLEETLSLRHNPLLGLHQLENILAAVCLARVFGITMAEIEVALPTFKGLPHRLERVGEKDRVVFYDDSKGTNVGALAMSLASFDQKIVLIAGGRDKNGDFASLVPMVKAKVDAVFLIGEASSLIRQAWRSLDGVIPLVDAGDMARAVKEAFGRARLSGCPVVLSPACASFDQFRDYHHRGEVFREEIGKL